MELSQWSSAHHPDVGPAKLSPVLRAWTQQSVSYNSPIAQIQADRQLLR